MSALARLPRLAFGRPDTMPLARAIEAVEALHAGCRATDAGIHEALGWSVEQAVSARGREWLARGPASGMWIKLPAPTARLDDAARLVPHGWSWGAGVQRPHGFAWCGERHPVRQGVRFYEAQAITPALALTRVALFAWLALARRDEEAA